MRCWLAIAILPSVLAQQAPPLGTSAAVARGDKLFAQGCSVGYCHGSGGSAARSPRLRGRTFEKDYLINVIRNGIPNSAMPAWGDRLTDTDIDDLARYIQSLAHVPIEVTGGPSTEAPAAAPGPEKTPETPVEHRQGRELFFDLTRDSRCSICHRLIGFGPSVGPDITKVSAIKVADAARVLRFGRPRVVRAFTLKDGDKFPGIVVDRDAALTRVYDLSATPPVLRNIPNTEVASIARHPNWRHRTAVQAYSIDELQSIWDYVRFVAGVK